MGCCCGSTGGGDGWPPFLRCDRWLESWFKVLLLHGVIADVGLSRQASFYTGSHSMSPPLYSVSLCLVSVSADGGWLDSAQTRLRDRFRVRGGRREMDVM